LWVAERALAAPATPIPTNDESSVYRMDHYLGKEMVQNLLVLRFANRIFEPLWDREHIDHVQITSAETVGVEGRGGYYEKAGVVRDMLQNHLLQVLAMVAMEPPSSLSPEAVHEAKREVMASARAFTPERIRTECVRGQYAPGLLAGGPVPGYRQEPGVAPDSRTETFAMLTMRFDNPRWAGVPFYVRSGKRMAERLTEVVVQFKDGPLAQGTPNQLHLRIQPDEGIALRFATKAPISPSTPMPREAGARTPRATCCGPTVDGGTGVEPSRAVTGPLAWREGGRPHFSWDSRRPSHLRMAPSNPTARSRGRYLERAGSYATAS
jgi:glucose-6-phosphate 1-dehydrogenase